MMGFDQNLAVCRDHEQYSRSTGTSAMMACNNMYSEYCTVVIKVLYSDMQGRPAFTQHHDTSDVSPHLQYCWEYSLQLYSDGRVQYSKLAADLHTQDNL